MPHIQVTHPLQVPCHRFTGEYQSLVPNYRHRCPSFTFRQHFSMIFCLLMQFDTFSSALTIYARAFSLSRLGPRLFSLVSVNFSLVMQRVNLPSGIKQGTLPEGFWSRSAQRLPQCVLLLKAVVCFRTGQTNTCLLKNL